MPPADPSLAETSIFPTELGWIGIVGRGGRLGRLVLGHGSAEAVRDALARAASVGTSIDVASASMPAESSKRRRAESDWNPALRRQLERYAAGAVVDFSDCDLELFPKTAFQSRVLEATRRIPYGSTISYAELAVRAGCPGAARAVGNVMASNRIPLIVPCHRVVAAGKLGGYSAPQGVELKRRLLAMEAEALAERRPSERLRTT